MIFDIPLWTTSLQMGTGAMYANHHCRAYFYAVELVFNGKENRWISHRDCVWKAPSLLTNVYALSSAYRGCKPLFCSCLAVGNATIDHVVAEIISLNAANTTKCKELLILLNEYLATGSPMLAINKLKGKRFIPVTDSASSDDLQVSILKNYNEDIWYYPDRPSLYNSFVGKVPLLDFSVQEVRKLSPLINALGHKYRRLSEAVEEATESSGDPIYDSLSTRDLQKRSQYFVRYVSLDPNNRLY